MSYQDLTLHQRISLKGYFQTEDYLDHYRISMLFFGFVDTVNWFLTGDINHISKNL